MYHCRVLVPDEISDTYNRHMKKDFPKNELKPLPRIFDSMEKGQYICYGIFEETTLCGYAYYATITDNGKKYYLLDYFAVVSDMRDRGIGSEFLSMLHGNMSDVEMVLCEAETPSAVSGEERRKRERRIEFYLRNNFIDTGVAASAFGVDYTVLELGLGKKHTVSEIRKYYSRLYRSFLPEKRKRKPPIHSIKETGSPR